MFIFSTSWHNLTINSLSFIWTAGNTKIISLLALFFKRIGIEIFKLMNLFSTFIDINSSIFSKLTIKLYISMIESNYLKYLFSFTNSSKVNAALKDNDIDESFEIDMSSLSDFIENCKL